MSSSDLLVSHSESVLRLTINRPQRRNALSLRLLDDLGAALREYGDRPALRCAVITAAGDRAFAAGGDLKELQSVRAAGDAAAMSDRGRRALDAIRRFPLPVVGALNGVALGGGAELAMACDLRVAAANAEIGFLQARLNVTTAWGGGVDLLATLGPTRALDIMLAGRRIPAAEALALGLVNRVCAPGESLQDCVETLIAPWLARSPQVMRGFKAMAAAQRNALHERLRGAERDSFVATWIHEDHWLAAEQAERERRQQKN